MKISATILLSIFIFSFEVLTQPPYDFIKQEEHNFFNIQATYDEFQHGKESSGLKGWKQFRRWENFWQTRVKPDGTFPSGIEVISELEKFKGHTTALKPDRTWQQVGPFANPASTQSGIGRVNVIRFKPKTTSEIWIGSASGGVWHSKDKGKTWAVFDFTQSLSLGITDIAFSESEPNIVYVATGDANGLGAAYSTYSAGIIKTTDGGLTWDFTNLAWQLSQGNVVSGIVVHPNNPNIIIASTNTGIYKSTDGGDSWRIKTSTSEYFRNISMKPGDPDILVSSTYSNSGSTMIYRSSDNGESWQQVHTLNGVRRSVISFAQSEPSIVYLLGTSGSAFHSFLRSTNAGLTWTVQSSISTSPNILGLNLGEGTDRTYGQGWYDLSMDVYPADENTVYTGGINIWRTTDAGKTWNLVTHWVGGYQKPYVHADIHCLVFDLNTGFLYAGHDGGVDYSDFPTSKWYNLNKGLSITQYYKIAVANTNEDYIYSGSQDNGSHKFESPGWVKVYGGDGMDCAVDYTDPKRAIISLYYGQFFKTINGSNFYEVLNQTMTGENGAWVAPLEINPVNPKSYYAGYRNVWKSTDGGSKWVKISNINIGTLLNIAIGRSDTNYIYVASSSTLAFSSNGGATFTNINGAPSPIKGIAVDPLNSKRIWVAVGGFNRSNKVMMYDGEVWTNLTGNIPNVPVNCIIYQLDSPDRLFIGTDIGVMTSDYNSGVWQFFGSDMPNLIVSDIEINYKNNRLYAGTYGRGVWNIQIDNCNLPQPQILVEGKTELCADETVTLTAVVDSEDVIWSNGQIGKSIIVSESGLYSYSYLDKETGCQVRSNVITVTRYSVPNLRISTIGKFPVCEGDSIDLGLSASIGFGSYLWNNGETTRRISINKAGKYSVVAMTKDSCVATAEIDVQIQSNPSKPEITRWNSLELISSPAHYYQWYLNGQKLLNDTNRILIIKDVGTYTVEVFNEAGCSSISDEFSVLTGIPNSEHLGVSIYPNPTTGKIVLFFSSDVIGRKFISISNLIGISLFSTTIYSEREYELDLSNYPQGIYFIRIQSADKTKLFKVLKED